MTRIILFSWIIGLNSYLPAQPLPPTRLSGHYHKYPNLRISPDTPAAKAAALLPTEWALPGTAFSAATERHSPGGRHLAFVQTVRGYPVFHSELKINLTRDGACLSVLDNRLNLPADVPPLAQGVAADSAVGIALRIRGGEPAGHQLGLWLSGDTAVWALRVAVRECQDGSSWAYYIHCMNGTVLEAEYLGVHFHPYVALPADTPGTGYVFNPDPLTTAGQAYAAPYVNSNDQDVPVLNAERQLVTLRDITYGSGIFRLAGPHVSIEDINTPSFAPATSASPSFHFTRGQQGFEDVMCYYHIDTFFRYISSLGFAGLYPYPMRIDPMGYSMDNSAMFGLPNGLSYILLGQGGVNDAEDADVIIHEYGHALSFGGSPNTNSGTERRALDEGIGDYFAASYSRRLNPFRWADVFTWDGHNEFWGGRTAMFSGVYPTTSFASIHAAGQLWSTALMEAQLNSTPAAMDSIQLQLLFMLAPNITMAQAAQLALDADTLLTGGAYSSTLLAAFCNRQLVPSGHCTVAATEALSGMPALNVWPNPAAETLWFSCPHSAPLTWQPLTWQVIRSNGQSAGSGITETMPGRLDISGLSGGIYHLRVTSAEGTPVGAASFWVP